MRQFRSYRSVRGVLGNRYLYRDRYPFSPAGLTETNQRRNLSFALGQPVRRCIDPIDRRYDQNDSLMHRRNQLLKQRFVLVAEWFRDSMKAEVGADAAFFVVHGVGSSVAQVETTDVCQPIWRNFGPRCVNVE